MPEYRVFLVAAKHRERGVQWLSYNNPDALRAMAVKWLESDSAQPGDRFELHMNTLLEVIVKPESGEPKQELRPEHHEFVPGKGAQCDRCGSIHD